MRLDLDRPGSGARRRPRPAELTTSARPAPPPGPHLVAGARRAGLAAAEALARLGAAAPLRVWDAADEVAARADLERLGAGLTLGGDGVGLLDAEPPPASVVKSPGIPFHAPLIAAAAARGLPVLDELELGWRLDDRPVLAVTGTNGKSTVAELVRAVLAADGRRPAIAGNTLSGPPLSALPRAAADVVVCEVSSFQLEGVAAFLPDAAVVTNLTPEHLWHHVTFERYAACKRRLVIDGDAVAPLAVIGTGDAFGRDLAAAAERRGARVARVGPGGDYAVTGARTSWRGTTVRADAPGGPLEIAIASHGAHMAANALAALALADLLGVDRATSLPALAATAPVPGRFERVDRGGPVAVVVDFAHNADGIAAALSTARELAGSGRVLAVCSAPWTYDETALADMGRAAAAGAASVIVTTDRWHADDPAQAPPALERSAREAGTASVLAEPDRAAAIGSAIAGALAGDVVMILGRGARETALDADGEQIAFDDRVVAREALAAL